MFKKFLERPTPKPNRPRSIRLFKVPMYHPGETWYCATDGEGYREFVQAETRYEAAMRLGITDQLKIKP